MTRKLKKGANAIHFVAHNNITVGQTVTYSRIVVDLRPHNSYPIRVRLAVGVIIIEYPVKITTETADINTFKIQNQLRDLHTRRKICRMGHWKLLLRNSHGEMIIYENAHDINATRNYCTLQVK